MSVSEELATEQDLYHCYRLFLQREPDEAGQAYWTEMIRDGALTVRDLTHGFLESEEFQTLQVSYDAAEMVTLPEFSIFINPDDFLIGRVIQRGRSYEPEVTAAVRELLKPGDAFVDVGANIGYFTLLAASIVGDQGRVQAVEPNPENCRLLRKSITKNRFANIELHECAVADRRRRFTLDTPGSVSNGRVLEATLGKPDLGQFHVDAAPLDELLRGNARVDLIKIDIEGAEPLAFAGMEKTMRTHRPIVIFEFTPDFISDISHVDATRFLGGLHRTYRLHVLGGEAGVGDRELAPEQIAQLCARQHGVVKQLNLLGAPR